MRALRLPSLVLPILLAAALFAPTVTTSAPAVQLASLADPQPVFPITATAFYAVQSPGASRVHPNKPQDPHDTELINRQVQEMLYAGQQAGAVTSLAYAPAVNLTGSVLVRVAAGRRISVDLSSSATVVLGIDGWVTPQGSHLLHAKTASRLVATSSRVTSAQATLPLSAAGKMALVSVGVASALGYGNLSLYPDASAAPIIQTLSYGPQQPQSGFMWVRVAANGKIDVKLSSGALLYVDLLGLA